MVVDDEPGKLEITVAEANAAAEEGVSFEVGDMIEREVYSDDFGRMAALTAKQVVVQRLREAEQTQVDRYYKERQSNVVTGFVQRKDRDNVYLDLGKVDGVLQRFDNCDICSFCRCWWLYIDICEERYNQACWWYYYWFWYAFRSA